MRVLLLVREANPGIAHGKIEFHGILRPFENLDSEADFALLGELYRVRSVVQEDLFESESVADESAGNVSLDVENQFESFRRSLGAYYSGDLREHILEIERFVFDIDFPRFDFGEIENVVDDAEQMLACRLDFSEIVLLRRSVVHIEREPRDVDNRVERCPYFMAHVREESAFRARRILCLLLRRFESLARFPFVGDVLENAHHAGRVLLASEASHLDSRPERRSVAPDHQQFFPELALLCDHVAVFGRKIGPVDIGRKPEIDRLSLDFIGGAAKDFLELAVSSYDFPVLNQSYAGRRRVEDGALFVVTILEPFCEFFGFLEKFARSYVTLEGHDIGSDRG